jgi:hypothetical protein
VSASARSSATATRELAALAVRLAEARTHLERCRKRSSRAPAMAHLLAGLLRDFDKFFAAHGDDVDPDFQAAVRRDMQRLGEAVMHLQIPAGRA